MKPQKGTNKTQEKSIWLSRKDAATGSLGDLRVKDLEYEVMPSEEAVGRAMLDEITRAVAAKDGNIVMVIVGGRGGQALHRLLGAMAKTSDHDALFSRLDVFTQDALAPLRMDNGLSFVRDFERLLGEDFFRKVNSFTSMRTDAEDLESELASYVERLESLGGIDLVFRWVGSGGWRGFTSRLHQAGLGRFLQRRRRTNSYLCINSRAPYQQV